MKGSAVLIVFLVIALSVLIGLHWVVRADPTQRNFQFLPGMVESVPRAPQSPASDMDDGVTLDYRPPRGTVARGFLPLGYAATPEGALEAGQKLQNPLPEDDYDAVTRGNFVFTQFCSVCHGASGKGDGPVTTRGVPPPPSLLLAHAIEMTDGQMYHVISMGQANMASYSSQVERLDRWRVIRYIRSLQAAGSR